MASDDLIRRCIDRDADAWRELISAHRPLVLRVLVRTVGALDPSAIQDLEQELYLRLLADDLLVLRELERSGAQSLRAFLCTAALNLARDRRRRAVVRKVVKSGDLEEVAGDVADPGVDVESEYDRAERLALALRTAARLATGAHASRDLLIFKAYYRDGLTANEVAAMGVGLTPKGVETVVNRLMGKVRKALRGEAEDAA